MPGSFLRESVFFGRNRPGITCFIYPPGRTKNDKIAIGYVTYVDENKCSIQIQQFLGTGEIKKGNIVELDLKQWKNDVN